MYGYIIEFVNWRILVMNEGIHMTVVLGIIFIGIGFFFLRYLPVWGVYCKSLLDIDENDISVLDVRDYNQSYKDSHALTINIPVAYLKRYFHEIPNKKIHIVASNELEKNISIRILRKKGFFVESYSLTNCDCRKRTERLA